MWFLEVPSLLVTVEVLVCVTLLVCFYAVKYQTHAFGTRKYVLSASVGVSGKLERPKGPPADGPFVGNQLTLNREGYRYLDLFMEWYKSYGLGYEYTIPGYRFINMDHPIWLEHVQKKNQPYYGKAYVRLGQFTIQRNGIFTVDGHQWMMQRKSASNAFSRKHFVGPISTKLNAHVDILLGLLDNLAATGEFFDFQDVMLRFTMLFSMASAFSSHGTIGDLLTTDPACLKKGSAFVDAFDSASPSFDHRSRNAFWRITEKFDKKVQNMINTCITGVYGFMDPIVAERLRSIDAGERREDSDLLDLFITQTRDPWELSGWLVNVLFAGRDTTAFTVAFQLYEMLAPQNAANHALGRARAEIESQNLASGDRMLYDQMKDLPYLTAIWNETTRLRPASPRGVTQAYRDDVLPAIPELGVPAKHVKKGDLMAWSDWVMNRLPEVWGKDCCEFKPDRWLDADGKLVPVSLWKWHSFNAGPRTCLGKQLATFDALTVFSAILCRYDFTLRDPDILPGYTTGFNMGMATGCWISLSPRATT